MTEPEIQHLDMLDTDYFACLAKGYDPILDRNIIALFKEIPRYRHLTRFLELVTKDEPPTEDEWSEIESVWKEMCKQKGYENSELDRETIMARWL